MKEMNEVKKINWLFLSIVLVHLSLILLLVLFPDVVRIEGIWNIMAGQLLILVPAAIVVVFARIKLSELLFFRRIRFGNVLLIVLFVYLMMPLSSLLNAISMLFAENSVIGLTQEMSSYPAWVTWLFVGLIGPVSEELVCRGLIYESYKKSVSPLKAMVISALIFGLLHMNFNQMPYAFALGILLVLVKEATGSMLAPILFHVVFNTQSVVAMYLIPEDLLRQSEALMQNNSQDLLLSISVLLIAALVSTTLGLCLLPYIARREGRMSPFQVMKEKIEAKSSKIGGTPLYVGVALCFLFMLLQLFL